MFYKVMLFVLAIMAIAIFLKIVENTMKPFAEFSLLFGRRILVAVYDFDDTLAPLESYNKERNDQLIKINDRYISKEAIEAIKLLDSYGFKFAVVTANENDYKDIIKEIYNMATGRRLNDDYPDIRNIYKKTLLKDNGIRQISKYFNTSEDNIVFFDDNDMFIQQAKNTTDAYPILLDYKKNLTIKDANKALKHYGLLKISD